MIVIEPERQPAALLVARRLFQFSNEEVALTELRPDGPAGFRVAINGMLGAVVELFPIGGGFRKGEIRLRGSRAGPGHGAERKFVEDKVAIVAPSSRPFVREALIGQRLQQHGGDAGEIGVGVHCDCVVDGFHPGAENRAVRQIGVDRSAVGEGVGQVQHAPDVALFGEQFLPLLLPGGQVLLRFRQFTLHSVEAVAQVAQRCSQIRRLHLDGGSHVVVAAVGRVVEEGVELVILVVGDGIILVRVALRAVQRESEPRGADGGNPILHRLYAIFLGVTAAFVVDLGVAVEARRDLLLQRRVRQQISGELIDRELVEGLVAIVGVDDPFAVGPDGAGEIDLITIGIRVARQIQPAARHVFAVMRRRKQAIHHLLVSIR